MILRCAWTWGQQVPERFCDFSPSWSFTLSALFAGGLLYGFYHVYVVSFYSYFAEGLITKVLNSIKCLFCIDWDDHVGFFLHSVKVANCINWFSSVEPSLHSRNQSYLVMVYRPFIMLLNLVCQYFVKSFCINVLKVY